MPGKYSLEVDLKAKSEMLALRSDVKVEIKAFLKDLLICPFEEKVQAMSIEYSANAYDSILDCGCHIFWEAIRKPGHLSIMDHPDWTTIRIMGASFDRRFNA